RHLVLVGAPEPVAFFGHPSRPGRLAPEGCTIFTLAEPHEDCTGALRSLADALDASKTTPHVQRRETGMLPRVGAITPETIAQTLSALLPESAIVVDESITSGRGLMATT